MKTFKPEFDCLNFDFFDKYILVLYTGSTTIKIPVISIYEQGNLLKDLQINNLKDLPFTLDKDRRDFKNLIKYLESDILELWKKYLDYDWVYYVDLISEKIEKWEKLNR